MYIIMNIYIQWSSMLCLHVEHYSYFHDYCDCHYIHYYYCCNCNVLGAVVTLRHTHTITPYIAKQLHVFFFSVMLLYCRKIPSSIFTCHVHYNNNDNNEKENHHQHKRNGLHKNNLYYI